MQSHLQKLPPMAPNLRRNDEDKRRQTTTDDDRRRQTTRDDERRRDDASHANTAPTPRPPTINGNPSLRIREKHFSASRRHDAHFGLSKLLSPPRLGGTSMSSAPTGTDWAPIDSTRFPTAAGRPKQLKAPPVLWSFTVAHPSGHVHQLELSSPTCIITRQLKELAQSSARSTRPCPARSD